MQRRWEQTEVEKQRDLEILHEWHKQPGLGPMQIRSQLRRRGVRTSVHTVRRVMEEQGYRPPKVKSHSHHERYEAVRPNQLWHLDFVHRHIHLAGTFTLILLDDHSRYVVGAAVGDAERADTVIETFEAAVAKHGRPEAVMTDRGSAFWAWRGIGRFSRLLEELGVDQYVAEDKEPNGKVEVFNANVAKELFDKQRFDDVGQLQAALVAHLDWYNHRRTHQGLGGLLVPADRYYGRAEEVQRQLETGAGKVEDPHGLALEARLLSLFQVASRGGQTEVWLLGKRIL
jgi:transposase InsO family protein